MKPQQIAEAAFDVAVIAAAAAVLALIWTLSFIAVQAVVTFAFIAVVALLVANRLDPGPEAPKQPRQWREPPRVDAISEEEYDEGPIAP